MSSLTPAPEHFGGCMAPLAGVPPPVDHRVLPVRRNGQVLGHLGRIAEHVLTRRRLGEATEPDADGLDPLPIRGRPDAVGQPYRARLKPERGVPVPGSLPFPIPATRPVMDDVERIRRGRLRLRAQMTTASSAIPHRREVLFSPLVRRVVLLRLAAGAERLRRVVVL